MSTNGIFFFPGSRLTTESAERNLEVSYRKQAFLVNKDWVRFPAAVTGQKCSYPNRCS